jgi:hypothetical protein
MVLLVTEARDMMGGQRHDWRIPEQPLKEKIEPWGAEYAELRFLAHFRELKEVE